MNKILVIGDTHWNEKREKAISIALDGINKTLFKYKRFTKIILLGDLYDKDPTTFERASFANFIANLKKYTKELLAIKGTGRHAYTNSVWHCQDLKELSVIMDYDQLELGKYLFVHDDIIGLRYASGHRCDKGLDLKQFKGKHIIAGHFHSSHDAKNLTVLGSVYKTNFSEINDQKRILIIEDDKFNFINIDSRPMYQINLVGINGKIKNIKLPKEKEIDLKIIVNTDTQTLPEVNRVIAKIKEKYDIENFILETNIESIKVDVPKNLDRKELLYQYCKKKKVDFNLVEKEL